MEAVVKMSTQGQISVPVKIRELLELKPKDTFVIRADVATGNVNMIREKTMEEQLTEFRNSLSPETKARIKKYAGKTAAESREEWDNSPEGKRYYREKYFDGN